MSNSREYAIKMYEMTPEGDCISDKLRFFEENLPILSEKIKSERYDLVRGVVDKFAEEYDLKKDAFCVLNLGGSQSSMDYRSDLDYAFITKDDFMYLIRFDRKLGEKITDSGELYIPVNMLLNNPDGIKMTLDGILEFVSSHANDNSYFPERRALYFSDLVYGNPEMSLRIKDELVLQSGQIASGIVRELEKRYWPQIIYESVDPSAKTSKKRINVKEDLGGLRDMKMLDYLSHLNEQIDDKMELCEDEINALYNSRIWLRAVRNCLHVNYEHAIDNIFHMPDFLDEIDKKQIKIIEKCLKMPYYQIESETKLRMNIISKIIRTNLRIPHFNQS